MPQHIGIVACSAEGAALCYRTICVEGAELLGPHAHPEVSLHGQSLADYTACLERGVELPDPRLQYPKTRPQLWIEGLDQRIAGFHLGTGGLEHLQDEAVGAGTHLGLLGQPDDPLGRGPDGDRKDEQRESQQRGQAHHGRNHARALLGHAWVPLQVP